MAHGGDMAVPLRSRATGWSRRLNPISAILLFAAGLIIPAHAGTLLFVGDSGGGYASLTTFDGTTGAFINQDSISGLLGFPTGVAVGPDGNVYVGDNLFGTVDRFSGTTGGFIDQFIPAGTGIDPLVSPSGLAFGPGGNLYVADYGSGGLWLCRCLQRNGHVSHTVHPAGLRPCRWTGLSQRARLRTQRQPVHHGRDQRHRRFRPHRQLPRSAGSHWERPRSRRAVRSLRVDIRSERQPLRGG